MKRRTTHHEQPFTGTQVLALVLMVVLFLIVLAALFVPLLMLA